MWIIDQMTPGNTAYNIPVACRICGELDVSALQECFNQIISRHESWRTTFRESGGAPVQEIHPACRIQLRTTDLGYLPAGEREAKFSALAAEEVAEPFDLRRLPLLRVSLFKLGQDEHVLLINLHHIICDAWSWTILARELTALYAARLSGQPHPLPDLPLQFGDYALWQQQKCAGPAMASQLAFWRERLGGDRAPLPVPADHPRPARPSPRGGLSVRDVPGGLAALVRNLARQEGVTLFILTLAAFKALLARYSGETDICIGSPIAQRPNVETEGLLGYFLNMLALRSDVSGDPDFRELLRRVRSTVLDAFQHQDVPFEKIVEELQPARDPSHQPLFQIAFVLLPAGETVPAFAGATVRPQAVPATTAKFELTLFIEETPGGLRTMMEYSADQFEAATADRMLESFELLLAGAAADPSTPLSRLPVLSAAQRHRILTEWSGSERPYPRDQTIAARFAECAAQTPAALAVTAGGERLTYAALDARANRTARFLQARGIRAGDFVGLRAERSLEFVVQVLGIAKAGAAYVPLDEHEPAARRATMQAACKLILGPEPEGEVSAEPVASAAPADGPAYVLFTSGSTGLPKGVSIPHRGITRLVVNNDYAPFQPDDVVAFAANVCFDAATFEIWGALLNGAALVITPREVLLSPTALAAHLAQHRVTVLFLTTSLFNRLAHEAPAMFGALRILVFGGEAADAASVRLVLENGKPQRLVNGYGPTEATTFAICHAIGKLAGATVPIGRPIANTRVFLLDRVRQPVPVGVAGEIYIGGPGVALGYLGRPELTAECFVETAFGRLYRTGDFARWLADGTIEFQGRLDQQFKLRGFRIEPAEIETQLRLHPAVAQCAVLPKVNPSGETVPVAYLVRRAGQAAVSEADFRQYLVRNLPPPFVPAQWFWLSALPLTANGKLDHRALPEPTREATPLREFVPPQGRVQTQLVALWEEVLKRHPIGVSDDFFDLGGHSLIAIQLISRIRETFRTDLPVHRLFSTPTIAGVAEYLAAHGTPPPAAPRLQSLLAIQQGDARERPFFLVPGGWGAEVEFLVYGMLARHVGADQPFYGLKARGSDGLATPHRTLAEMVADYVAEIRARQPHGPYLIGGECVGGVAAYEIARALEAAGEKVALLVLLGTVPPSRAALRRFRSWDRAQDRERFWKVRIAQPFHDHVRRLAQLPLGGKLNYLWTRATRHRSWNATTDAAESEPLDSRKVLAHYPRMLMGHQLGAYTGKLTLLIDETTHGLLANSGWDKVHRSALEVHVLPGTHLSYIREFAATAAAKLREVLDLAKTNDTP